MPESNKRTMHFTLGPVQGFVAQARRTRDLWGGSFLLSWLSGNAMKAALDHKGEIEFPVVKDESDKIIDPLLQAIMAQRNDSANKNIGSLPNRFKAQVASDFDPASCRDAVLAAWHGVATRVFERFVAPIAEAGQGTKEIWDRQVNSFWEIAWVVGDAAPGDAAWLDARKNWRNHRPPVEGGDHCTLMGDWQELSGYVRSKSKDQRQKQDNFWLALRGVKGVGQLDVRDGERLCAIALVKRFFPLVAKDAIGWKVDTRNWPSTSYLAAVPWIKAAWEVAPDAVEKYATLVKEHCADGVLGESKSEVACLKDVPASIRGLDGRVFYPHVLEGKQHLPLKSEADRKRLVQALGQLQKTVQTQSGASVSSFYALLLMDGDSLGALLRCADPQKVSEALAIFTGKVPDIVRQHNGVTVYAGGDDVLALLPLQDAISAAAALREAYRGAFNHQPQATISGAIVFAHQQLPLMGVLGEAHHQLDDIAKDRNGRDSLAIAVLKSGGALNCQWVSAWEVAGGVSPAHDLEPLADDFAQNTEFSSKLLYALRDRFGMLLDDAGNLIPGLDPVPLLAAEFMRNGDGAYRLEEAELQAHKLLQVCTVHSNRPDSQKAAGLQPEGALLIRFLAKKGGIE